MGDAWLLRQMRDWRAVVGLRHLLGIGLSGVAGAVVVTWAPSNGSIDTAPRAAQVLVLALCLTFCFLMLHALSSAALARSCSETWPRAVRFDAATYYLLAAALALAGMAQQTATPDKHLGLVCTGMAVLLALVWLCAKSLPWPVWRPRLGRPLIPVLLLLLCLAYVVVLSAVAIFRLNRCGAWLGDLGIMDQSLWNTAHGRWFQESGSHGYPINRALTGRLELVYLLLAPLYWIWPNIRLILVLQSVALSLGAIPTYLLGIRVTRSRTAALGWAFAYLAYPALEYANLFDVHGLTFATPLLLSTFYCLYVGRSGPAVAFGLLALCCREDVALPLFALGIYAAVRRQRLPGSTFLLLSPLYFLLAFHWLPGLSSGPGYGMDEPRWGLLSLGVGGLLRLVVTDPGRIVAQLATTENLAYLGKLLLPVSLLPLVSPAALLFALPTVAANLLSDWGWMHEILTQYTSCITPFVFVAAIFGFRRLQLSPALNRVAAAVQPTKESSRRAVTRLLALQLLLSAVAFNRLLGPPPLVNPMVSPAHATRLRLLGGAVPAGASLSVMNHVGAHAAHRLEYYEFPARMWEADYLLVDLTATYWWPQLEINELVRYQPALPSLLEVLRSRTVSVERYDQGALLLRRRSSGPTNLERLFAAAQPGPRARGTRVGAQFLECRAVPVSASPGNGVGLQVCWQGNATRAVRYRVRCQTGSADRAFSVPAFMGLEVQPTGGTVQETLYFHLGESLRGQQARFWVQLEADGHLLPETPVSAGSVAVGQRPAQP
jgi:uncharacterized membrane protein